MRNGIKSIETDAESNGPGSLLNWMSRLTTRCTQHKSEDERAKYQNDAIMVTVTKIKMNYLIVAEVYRVYKELMQA